MVQGKPDPYKNPATGATRPTNQIGGYEYLQRAEGKSLLETAFDVSKDVVDNPDNYTQAQQDAVPFKSARVGNKDWYDSSTYGLELKDSDWSGDSGFFHAKVNDGWEVAFVMLTENNDYFEDNVESPRSNTNWTGSSTWFEKLDNLSKDQPIWVQDNAETSDSRACFILVGDNDDYVSVDIDDEVKGISNFQVRIDGVKFVSNAGKIDNETFIGIKWCRRWNPNMPMVDDIPEEKQEDDGEEITEDDIEEESGQKEPEEDDGDNDDGDDDGDDEDDTDDDENYSIFLVLGGITLILVASFLFLRGGSSGE